MNALEKQLDWAQTQNFLNLELPNDKVCIEYVWIGGKNCIRSKAKTVSFIPKSADELPPWNYDGSSTYQASGKDSEVIMVPRSIYKDPFRRGNNFLAMCDTYDGNGNPLSSNTRIIAKKIFDQALDEEPWYGLEQEYTMFTVDGHPFGWPKGGYPGPQGPYYCSAGANVAHGRHLVEAHYRACLYAGISVSGINAEVMPGQWEYQVGPVKGIEAADQLWISRYILHRLGEIFNIVISFDPKPVLGDWNGAGLHTNFSTKKMREEGGIKYIYEAVDKLKDKHHEHIAVYGEGNERRLTGKHETAPIHEFSCGIAHRGASIRIVREAIINGCGYFEDRRPASNADPYLVTSKIFETCVLYKKEAAPAEKQQ